MEASLSGRRIAAREPARRNGGHRLSLAIAAPHPWLWAATVGIAAVDGLWLYWLGISLQHRGFLALGSGIAILLAAAAFWGLVRPEPTLRAMALSTAFLASFTIGTALLHYLGATLDRPLIDRHLAAAEAALGFDWRSYVALLDQYPALARGLALAYHSSGPQVALVVIALSALKRTGRLWRFVRLFAATLLAVVVISSLFPAKGPYAFYMGVESGTSPLETVGATWHLEPLSTLRTGEAGPLALADLRGLATFPSFHVCLAVITAWALAPIPIIGALAALLNGAVIVATISAGGHYLPDVLAGGLLGGLALACPRLGVTRLMRQRESSLSSPGEGRPVTRPRSRARSPARDR